MGRRVVVGGGPAMNDSSFSQFLLHRIPVQVCVRAFICIIYTYSLHPHTHKQCPPPPFLQEQGPRRFKNTFSEEGITSLVEVKKHS